MVQHNGPDSLAVNTCVPVQSLNSREGRIFVLMRATTKFDEHVNNVLFK